MGGMVDWTHVGSIRVGGLAGEGPGDGWQRDSGGTTSVARVPAQCGADLGHVWLWELEWGLGRGLESLVRHGRQEAHRRR
jgi:hypothetical protein